MSEQVSVDGAMALPAPAPSSGPLFGDVANMPVKSVVGHAEPGLSKLTGLPALLHQHRHLKYVVAAGVLVVLVIVVILLSWQSDRNKNEPKLAELERRARAAAMVEAPAPVAQELPTVAPSPEPKPLPMPHTGKRASRPASPTNRPMVAQEPIDIPTGMSRSDEKPIPLAAIHGTRAAAGGAGAPRVISQNQISDVIRRRENQAALKSCYERALKRDGRLRQGRLDITVSIGLMGNVQRVRVNGSSDFMVIEGCLKEAIRHWRFPASGEEYTTSFPLILQGG